MKARWIGHWKSVIDTRAHWDFDDPGGSEERFRALASASDGAERAAWLTQAARALGLQERYDEAHDVLDTIAPGDPEVDARVALERGRVVLSSGDPEAARPLFEEAGRRAAEAGLDDLHVDALHMVARAAPPEERLAAHEEALAAARAAHDPRARDRDASILTDIGRCHADAGDHGAALVAFTEALECRERIGDTDRVRAARWTVAWSLRHLGRTEEALALQGALKAELDAVGEHDPLVDEELALLSGTA